MASDASFSFKVLAKPNKSLEEHTEDAIQFLCKYLNWHDNIIDKIARQLEIKKEELQFRLFATVYLHDIGKANYFFQQRMQKPEETKLTPGEVPHPLLAVPFAMGVGAPLDGIYYEALAIMSHHSHFSDLLYGEEKYRNLDLRESYGEGYFDFARKFYYNLPYRLKEAKITHEVEVREPEYWFVRDLRNKLVLENEFLQDGDETVRSAFSLFVSALHYADWLASGGLWEYKYSLTDVRRKLIGKLRKASGFEDLYAFQKQAANLSGNVFIRAPTGKGKTEAGLFWADKNQKGGKIIYLLPTRVASNAIYERCQKYFGRKDVGLSHGTAALVIAEEKGLLTGEFKKEAYRGKKLLSSTFMTPITVATVDQLLLSEFNWGYWELVKQNASNSLIIFDEIHSYDFYTTSLILEIIKELKDYNTKFALMSATLPSYLRKALQQVLLRAPILEEHGFDNLRRHKIHLQECLLEEKVSDILRDYENRKSVLVIADTVRGAREIYKKLEESFAKFRPRAKKPIMLYHSLFVEKDRRTKDKEIQKGANRKGFIAVATQVVEVSLDMDYDVLYTEVAPIDALIQRMGRVNRKGRKGIADVWVCKPTKGAGYIYGTENLDNAWKILERINEKEITESELRSLVDEQYPIHPTLKKLDEERNEVMRRLNELKDCLWYVQTLDFGTDAEEALRSLAKTRKGRVANVEVIPLRFQEEVEKAHTQRRFVAIVNYILRAPLYLVHEFIIPKNGVRYVNLNYTYDYGLMISEKAQMHII